ncbi:MAG: acetyl-CoA decarbonylase/synthase complex subunit gamma [Dehalococcoidales bacterium]|nr:acetyl-CoA decarbonylase/synthase complex subunit gamma [Dehalococcoidales bacterium]
MPLTGIEIFKLLPKTNCGECGVPTCLAFAMSLAGGKAELTSCPYVSEEAKTQLMEASAPAITPVTIGVSDRAFKIGNDTVMFRHEKTFVNPPALAILITDTMNDSEIDARLERFKLQYERIGVTLRAEMIAIRDDSGDAEKFESIVTKVKQNSDGNIILMSNNPDVMATGLKACANRRPLIYAITEDNLDQMVKLARDYSCPIVAKATNLEGLSELTTKLTKLGIKDIVLDSGARTPSQTFKDQILIRNAALKNKFRPLGFPTIVLPCEMTDNPMKEAVFASIFIAKYSGIIVLSDFQGESLFPLLLERLNIFTDPQRPLATTEGIYEIGGPDENSPVLITTNFSLTYFLISGEIETSRIPSYLLIMDTEGLSVLTAWAAGKFNSDTIVPFIKKTNITEKIKHRKLIIPGYIAAESGGIEEALPGWEVLVGPREGANIPAYLKIWDK